MKPKQLVWDDYWAPTYIAHMWDNVPGMTDVGYAIYDYPVSKEHQFRVVINGRELGRVASREDGKKLAQEHFNAFVNGLLEA